MSFSVQFVVAASAAMIINAAVIPFLIKLAQKHGWYDSEDERKIHQGNIPRIGGIGIALSFFTAMLIVFFARGSVPEVLKNYRALFLCAAVINIVGLLDDFTDLRPLYKLFAQIAVAIFTVVSGYYFKSFYLPFAGVTIAIPVIGQIVAFFWIVGITNAVNLIDGMDGLSSGTTGIAAFFIGLSAFAAGNVDQAILVFILFGSLAGFFLFNFPPAKLFMGDSGSLFTGFVLSALPFYSIRGSLGSYTLILSISFLFIPILDTIAAIIRRKIKGVPFHSPDREHLHHKLLALGLSQKQVLAVVYSATFVLSLTAYLFILTRSTVLITILIALWAVFAFLFFLLSRAVKAKKL